MEIIKIPKKDYNKVIKQKDEFYDPLMFDTSLIQARFLGKEEIIELNGNEIKVLYIGILRAPLLKYLKDYIYAIEGNYLDHVSFEEGKMIMKSEEEKKRLYKEKTSKNTFFNGASIISNPKKPPYTILISKTKNDIIFYSLSDEEYHLKKLTKENNMIDKNIIRNVRKMIKEFVKS